MKKLIALAVSFGVAAAVVGCQPSKPAVPTTAKTTTK